MSSDTLTLTALPRYVLVSWELSWLLGLLCVIGTVTVLQPVYQWFQDILRLLSPFLRFWERAER